MSIISCSLCKINDLYEFRRELFEGKLIHLDEAEASADDALYFKCLSAVVRPQQIRHDVMGLSARFNFCVFPFCRKRRPTEKAKLD